MKVSFIKSIYVHLNNNYVVRFSVIYVPQNYKECYWTANITIYGSITDNDNEYNALEQFDPEDEKSYKIVYSYYMLSTWLEDIRNMMWYFFISKKQLIPLFKGYNK